jgi:hypothetical protein
VVVDVAERFVVTDIQMLLGLMPSWDEISHIWNEEELSSWNISRSSTQANRDDAL